MKTVTIGKMRGLQRCTSDQGTFTCLALDHRQNLRRSLNPSDPAAVTDEQLSHFKLEVTAVLAHLGTAVLLDPEVSAAQAIAAGLIPRQTGLVVAVEATGYTGDPNARRARVLPGWSIEKAKRMGADAVKLLVYYHPDAATASEIEEFTGAVAQECQKQDLLLMLEPLSYPLDTTATKLTSAEKRYVVVETARRLVLPGVDVLKTEFPLDVADDNEDVWAEACAEISSASSAPWILLSAAADFETYLRQVTVACKSGASGVAVGRAVWKEAVNLNGEARLAFLHKVGSERFAQLADLCSQLGKPVSEFYSAPAPFDWYKNYSSM